MKSNHRNAWIAGAVVAVILALAGLTGNHDMQLAQIEAMQNVCEQSHKVIDGTLENRCTDLIEIVQSQGFEVLSKDGHFWAESYN